jgi:hypothetical protein
MKSDISVALKSFLGRGENKMAVDRKRGRPKGTGINDHEMLLKIASIMVAHPTKKRTTAIKEVGITNASVVRRLRDKYQAEEAHLLAAVHAANAAAAAPAASAPVAAKTSRKSAANGHAAAQVAAPAVAKKGKAAASQPAPAAVAAVAVAAVAPVAAQVHVEPIVAAPQATAAPHVAAQPAPAATKPAATATQAPKLAVDPLAALFEGLNIETLVTQFIGHALGLSATEIKNSPIPALIRQQAQLADLVLPLLASQFLGSKQSSKAA